MRITLATLASATAQQVFDQVRDHMLRQGRQSHLRVASSSCAYRSHDGLKCAAGCLIGDDEYLAAMEGRRWDGVVEDGHAPAHLKELIGVLQYIHDVYRPDGWEARLRQEAKNRDLAWTITLASLPTASAQEVFEQVAKHLLKQNAVARGDRGCQYRTHSGLACAAGSLLSDADAAALTDDQNGSPWGLLRNDRVVPKEHASLIVKLQYVHDGYLPSEWASELIAVAALHGLDASFMDLPASGPLKPISFRETTVA